jgi:hypothetical protein
MPEPLVLIAYLPRAQPLIAEALGLTSTLTLDVYGEPGPIMRQVARTNAGQGARVRVHPHRLDGRI